MNFLVNENNIILIVISTFLCSFLATFLVKKIAVHIGAMDKPNYRKVHKEPTPRLGGLAIFLGFLFGYIFFGSISTQMISILIGGIIIILTGIVDDVNPISAKTKFFCQLVATSIVVFYGKLFFTNITILGLELTFCPLVGKLLSIFFMVSVINAINLVDGLNGLSSGISAIYFLTIAVLGFAINKFGGLDIILSLIMIGATLGFWVHNFPKGKIFMGDTGSMFLGFMISVIALIGYKIATITSIIIPIIILFVPILDTSMAIMRRLLKHESIGTPDKEHLHHQLLKMTDSPVKTVLIIYAMNIAFSAVSILYTLGDNLYAIVLYLIIMSFFIILILKTDILFKHKNRKEMKK